MADSYYPLPAFYFKVEFSGFGTDSDTSFQDVSGLKADVQTESYEELGENGCVYRLPTGLRYSNVTLKRGIASSASPLVTWCSQIFDGNFMSLIEPKKVDISLMNEEGQTTRSWSLINAYPLSWDIGSFSSKKNEVAIETIVLNYDYFTITV